MADAPRPPVFANWPDGIQRCENCARWSPYAMGVGSCDLPREPNPPVRLTDPGGIETHPNFYCIAWKGKADGQAEAGA